MNNDQPITFISNIPILSSIYKEQVYDHLVAMGADPNDKKVLPFANRLYLAHEDIGADDVLCGTCAKQFPRHYAYVTAATADVDVPPACARCERRLYGSLTLAGARAVLTWSSDHVLRGGDLAVEDWLDIWLSVQSPHLGPDDPLWDHVGLVTSKMISTGVAKPADTL